MLVLISSSTFDSLFSSFLLLLYSSFSSILKILLTLILILCELDILLFSFNFIFLKIGWTEISLSLFISILNWSFSSLVSSLSSNSIYRLILFFSKSIFLSNKSVIFVDLFIWVFLKLYFSFNSRLLLLFWIFSLKYSIISLKFELSINDFSSIILVWVK